ncbi:MAG TPA: S8 family serine peptidase [Nocardioides sp.]|nr:S8 family serine peptidase [Nocardioides sp.]
MSRSSSTSFSRATRGVLLATVAAATVLVGAGGARATADPGGETRLVVGYRATASPAAVRALDRLGATERSAVGALHARVVTVPSGRAAAVLAALHADASVAYAEVDGTEVPTDVTPDDPYFPTGAGALSGGEWGSLKTQAPAAWSATTGSSSVVVAVIDSGVVASQSDLSPVLVPGWNVLTGTADTSDTYGHGTEVAGVAVAGSNNGQGVAAYCWRCRLMPIKVYTSAGAYSSDIASGMVWAVDHGARVLNVSMAGTTPSSVLSSAVSYATAHGAVVVAAAGNNGNSTATYPASIPGVISVAATDQTDTPYSYSDYGSWVDVAAPGSTVTTLPNGGYGAVGGTSIASPAVAGIAGLLLSAKPTATPADVANALFTTTDPITGSKAIAYGRVNAAKAVAALAGSGTTSAPPPSAPAPVTAPTVSGSAQSGQTLTATSGSWSNSPTSYAYRWQRCDGTGAGCADVAGATTATYLLSSADVGSTVRVVVTASNAGGSTSAASVPTSVVTSPVATTTTSTFSGSLTRTVASRSYSTPAGAGPITGTLSFGKCSAFSLTVATTSGSVVAQASGPNGLAVSATVPAGTYVWTVSSSCKVSFTLAVTATS